MDPSSAAQQEMSNQTLETILVGTKQNNNMINVQDHHQKKPRPQPEQALKCPRCESTNTKFCYYNNYSLSQPRYFCKSCRRYWTKGGTLRNVPVGGGCRKNKRSSSTSSSSTSSSSTTSSKIKPFHEEPLNNPLITAMPSLGYDAIDLNLAFARLHQKQSSFGSTELSMFGNSASAHCDIFGNSTSLANLGGQNGNFGNGLGYGFMMGADDHHHHHHHHEHHQNNSTSPTTVAMPFEESNSKQEDVSANGNNNENPNTKFLWGFPWQMAAEETAAAAAATGGGGAEMDTGRESWNGLSSSWHGLLNSPLV